MTHGESDSKSDLLLLMETTNGKLIHIEWWYFDIGCSNHMTFHQKWLVNFDDSRKIKIRFVNNGIVPSEGVGDFLIKEKQMNQAFITDVSI